jgi:Holliday junction resolvase
MSEQQIQSKIIKQLEADGWYVLKLIKSNKNGIPDLVAFKENEFQFIEVKTEKGVLSELQKYRIKELQDLGFKVHVKNKP